MIEVSDDIIGDAIRDAFPEIQDSQLYAIIRGLSEGDRRQFNSQNLAHITKEEIHKILLGSIN